MPLPLLERATEDGELYMVTRRRRPARPVNAGARAAAARMPSRAPAAGEQYRFHVDLGACIGCKCCVVACNEQNGNPAEINWRRVAEFEGGWYPHAIRGYLSMGCNHCLEPTCLAGCPVDAYTKDAATGIVHHSADACIGCQYCTWNCSYGVPKYNAARGVVGKCDMCHGRLALGQAPACVGACPEGAIGIEIVDVAAWRARCAEAPAPGVPAGDHSLSTTRLTVPASFPPAVRPGSADRGRLEDPHWPLIVMTVLTQFSVGAFVTVWLLHLLGAPTRLGLAALVSLAVGSLALGASTLHLGRPIHAYRALRMWRRSWLSREVLCFSVFAAVASLYAGALWFSLPAGVVLGALCALTGAAGVFATACIYRVPARPAWNTRLTVAQFAATGAVLGPLFAAVAGAGPGAWLVGATVGAAVARLALIVCGFLRLMASDRIELKDTARLLSTRLAPLFVARGLLLVAGAIVAPLVSASPPALAAGLVLTLAGEVAGRYLFFVSVVPTQMATPYLGAGSEAA